MMESGGLCPQLGTGQSPWSGGEALQKLEAFYCVISSYFLYALESIVKIQPLYCT